MNHARRLDGLLPFLICELVVQPPVNFGSGKWVPKHMCRSCWSSRIGHPSYSRTQGGHPHRIGESSTKESPSKIAPFGDSRSITAYIEGRKLYVDALLYYAPDEPPLQLTHNELEGRPRKWDRNLDDSALEIVDENLVPRFQLIYKDARTVLLRGVFQFRGGAVVFEEDASHFFIYSRENEVKIARIFQYPSRIHQGQERPESSR